MSLTPYWSSPSRHVLWIGKHGTVYWQAYCTQLIQTISACALGQDTALFCHELDTLLSHTISTCVQDKTLHYFAMCLTPYWYLTLPACPLDRTAWYCEECYTQQIHSILTSPLDKTLHFFGNDNFPRLCLTISACTYTNKTQHFLAMSFTDLTVCIRSRHCFTHVVYTCGNVPNGRHATWV